MDILSLMDKVEAGEYSDDRFPVTDEMLVNGQPVSFTYRLTDAMQHAQVVMNRQPHTEPDGTVTEGVVTSSCKPGAIVLRVSKKVGIGLRIGGEVSLCFECGPEGGVYHPTPGISMAKVNEVAVGLADLTGGLPDD